jgi:hypothetical protein
MSLLILAAPTNPSIANAIPSFSILFSTTLILTVLATILLIIFLCLPSKSPTRYDEQINESVQ